MRSGVTLPPASRQRLASLWRKRDNNAECWVRGLSRTTTARADAVLSMVVRNPRQTCHLVPDFWGACVFPRSGGLSSARPHPISQSPAGSSDSNPLFRVIGKGNTSPIPKSTPSQSKQLHMPTSWWRQLFPWKGRGRARITGPVRKDRPPFRSLMAHSRCPDGFVCRQRWSA